MSFFSIFLLARVCIAFPYLYSVLFSLRNFENSVEMIKSKNIPFPKIALIGSILLRLMGGVFLVLDVYRSEAALVLLAFTVVATILFYGFWKCEGQERINKIFSLTSNIGLMGGLILLAFV